MGEARRALSTLLASAAFARAFHGWAALGWFVASPAVCVWLSQSIPFLVFISVYAVVTGHWSGYQAARAEEAGDDFSHMQMQQLRLAVHAEIMDILRSERRPGGLLD